jgi:UDP-3-O-[3-hydroxymyristoyl] glucosamine N-acyltransferase
MLQAAVSRLGDLAEAVGAELVGDPELTISGVGTLENAREGELSFLSNPSYRRYLKQTRASAVILAPDQLEHCPTAALLSPNPYLTYARVSGLLFAEPSPVAGIHSSAVIAASAMVAESACIGPCVVVGERTVIGDGVNVGPGSVIGDDCVLGEGSRLVANVTLWRGTQLGRRCLIHPGAVLGSDGFGLANDEGRWVKVPQLGRVIVGDDVEMGANVTIDRGALEDTQIADGVKLDNQVHIAHNVQIGEHTAIAGCTGIAGSTKVGRYCTMGGQVGLAGHLTIGDNVHFSGASQVTRSFTEPGYYSGNLPAMKNADWRKTIARLRHLDEMAKRLKELEKQIAAMHGDSEK